MAHPYVPQRNTRECICQSYYKFATHIRTKYVDSGRYVSCSTLIAYNLCITMILQMKLEPKYLRLLVVYMG